MKIRNIEVKNWRSIGSKGVDLKIGDITVISGANDSGKTAFLIASYATFKKITQAKDNYLERILFHDGSMHEDEDGIVKGNPIIKVTSGLTNYRIDKIIEFDQIKELKTILWSCILKKTNELGHHLPDLNEKDFDHQFNSILDNINVIYEFDSLVQHNDPLYEVAGKFDLTHFFETLQQLLLKWGIDINVPALHQCFNSINNRFDQILFKHSEYDNPIFYSFYITGNREFNPDRYGSSEIREDELKNTVLGHDTSELIRFIQLVRTEKARREGKYNKLLNYVKIIFPEVVEIEFDIPEGNRAQKDVYVKWLINNKIKRQPLSRSGAGIANALYLTGRLLCEAEFSGIAFIDEPETSLHPRLQIRFIKLLRRLSQDFSIQWVLSTHSPFILKNLKQNDNLYLFEHNGIETKSRPIELNDKQTVFEALGAYLPETLTSKGILFVEGATESEIFPIILEKCGLDIEKEGLLIIPLGGDNLFQIEPSDLKKIHNKVMVILDSDLCKPESDGGNVKQKKLNYQDKCATANVEFFMSRDYRYIESLYPKSILANILNINEEDLTHGPYDEVTVIPENSKVKVGRRIAEALSEEQAKELPFIQEILKWWD